MSVPAFSARLVIDKADLAPLQSTAIDPSSVEAVIAAAGRGTRLHADVPKVLVPIDGEPLLMRLLHRLNGLVSLITLVVHPSGRTAIERAVPATWPVPIRLVEQEEPTGMADAVLAADSRRGAHLRTPAFKPTILVIWGDQAGLGHTTLRQVVLAHQQHPRHPVLTMAAVNVERPYVHYVLDEEERVIAVLQRREGDRLPPHGLADCGCFVAQRVPLFDALAELRAAGQLVGPATGEQNFLPVVPYLGRQGHVLVARIAELSDTIGINTATDLERVQRSVNHNEVAPRSSRQDG
jgi:bifunctional UDP-N-acetylglucosamine pyrophosphorylase / glucosamine-1-phosphate N-acetyltransferase